MNINIDYSDELFFIYRLSAIVEEIKRFYSPGAKFILVSESRAFVDIFGVTESEAIDYRERFRGLIKFTNQSLNVELVDLIESLKLIPEFDEEKQQLINHPIDNRLIVNLLPAIILSINTRQYSIDDLMVIFNSRLKYSNLSSHHSSIRQDIFYRAKKAAALYFAFHKTREKLSTSQRCFPQTISCSMTPKKGSFTVLPINSGLFPHHGVGVINKKGEVNIAYEIDLLRSSSYRPIYLINTLHPFAYELI